MTEQADTATTLFAKANGQTTTPGSFRCYYCLAPCNEQYPSTKYVKPSFTSRDTVGCGAYVCGGCVAAMQEKAVIALPCGTVRTGQRIRCYSWVITETSAIAATKAHREWIFAQCMQPPPPPFVICLSDSGQKHLLYRAVVCHSQATVTVTLEGERIHYTPELLQNRRRICQRIAAVLGKPSLREPLTIQQQMRLVEYYQEPELLAEWLSVQSEPITRLATWLTPSREACQQ